MYIFLTSGARPLVIHTVILGSERLERLEVVGNSPGVFCLSHGEYSLSHTLTLSLSLSRSLALSISLFLSLSLTHSLSLSLSIFTHTHTVVIFESEECVKLLSFLCHLA